ncbi:MAG: hypothetical protein KDI71_19970, partial [Xanthomonadales bacterium]|nr:hypothetical protein [Xanthomonadales bacterium]
AQDLTGVSLNDNLPAGLLVATPSNAVTTCTGGTLSAASGGGSVSYSGGTVPAGTSCTIVFEVDASAPGSLLNTTSDLVSNAGTVSGASATLTADPLPLFSKAFAPDAMAIGDISTLTLSIDNSGSVTAISAIDFTDNLPAGLVLATPANASSTCTGGTLTAVDGGAVISYSGGSLAAGASCTVVASVTSASQGVYLNTTGDLSSSAGNSGPASATLTVSNRPSLSKAFNSAALFVNQTSQLILSIDHSAGNLDATALDLTDNLPAGLLVASPSNAATTCTGGTLTAVVAGSVVSYSGGSVVAGGSCQISVDVVAAAPGSYLNTTGDLSSSLGNSGSA